ncbi:cobalamin biosynthesis protein CobD [Prolixibacteraceae bacterium JC049]|nr:cobalamin biosynthesis protein CobD [Prolixibacteraceae bacterium JC049]
MVEYAFVITLLLGYVLDLLLGDPRWLPHPIVLFGNAISKGEKILNKGNRRIVKGMVLTILYCFITFTAFYFIQLALGKISFWAEQAWVVIFLFFGLANRSLIGEGAEVNRHLDEMGLEAGRKRLSWIVGRDTSKLDANAIRRAVLETMSENLSDGVVAPLFYYAIGGIPAMMTYKMINTFDSMIGYKSERYLYFGRFAAKLDDVVNYIPARLTGIFIGIVTFSIRSFQFILKYGRQHASPNAGYPESALAGALNCAFGGPNVYHGQLFEKPWIGNNHRDIESADLKRTIGINHAVTLFTVVLILLFQWL